MFLNVFYTLFFNNNLNLSTIDGEHPKVKNKKKQ